MAWLHDMVSLLLKLRRADVQAGTLQACNFAHVLGLYKMTGAGAGAFTFMAQGSQADVVLWAIARLQTRVFASQTYAAAMRIVAQEQAVQAAAMAQKAESDKQAQAAAALEHSQLRHARALRVARLKVGNSARHLHCESFGN